jgi:Ca2+-binding RTX toxin-like protein
MAIITGTEGADTLEGTNVDPLAPSPQGGTTDSGRDTINALGGDDIIFATTGDDTNNGGEGNDILDFSKTNKDIFLSDNGGFYDSVEFSRRFAPPPSEEAVRGSISNLETIIGNPNKSNTINDFLRSRGVIRNIRIDADLSTGRVTYFGLAGDTPSTYNVRNFDNILTPNSPGRFAGNDRNNKISAGDGSVIIGSGGNDTLSGRTLDYSNFDRAVKFATSGTVDKGGAGNDTVDGYLNIIGAANQNNTLDASSGASVDVNLANSSVKVTSADGTTKETGISNFVNAIGTNGNDIIVGSNRNGNLTGGGGNDTITGGTGNDRLTGTNSTARGVGEVDTLTGGGGRDKFILGDRNGAYYLGNGSNDYASITDFSFLNDSIDIGSLKDYSLAFDGTNTIDLFSGKDVSNRDLIAKIQLSDLNIAAFSKSSSSRVGAMSVNASIMGGVATSGVDAIASQIDILSGVNSTADVAI